MKQYLRQILIPVIWEIIFILSCFILPKEYFIYTNFAFYLGIILFFVIKKQFSFSNLVKNLRFGKQFWQPVVYTILGLILAFAITSLLERILPNLDDGMIGLQYDTWFKLILFAVSTILLPPVAEELFYRKAMINFKNMNILLVTTLVSAFLYALEHSLSWFGIIMCMIWAIPFSISYIKTKNVYVPMMAHLIVNIFGNGITVIQVAGLLAEH